MVDDAFGRCWAGANTWKVGFFLALPIAVPPRNRFTELDGLRGLAALMVVAFHLRYFILRLDPPPVVTDLVGGGLLMVDLFFVLSGFVLSRSMLSTNTAGDLRRFAMVRVRRFAPLHVTAWSIVLLVVTATAVLQLLDAPHAPRNPVFAADNRGLGAWLTSLFLLQGFAGPEYSGYSAAWSLSVELYLNILLVAVIALIRPARWKPLVAPAAVLGGATLLLLAERGHPNTFGVVGMGRGLYGLGLGMVVYQLYLAVVHAQQRRHGESSSRGSRRVAGVAAVAALPVMAAAMYRIDLVKVGHFLPIGLISAATVLALALPGAGPAHRLLNTGVAQWLGSRSFALYALHGPTLSGVQFCVRFLGFHRSDPRISALVVLTTVAGALVAAEFGHRFVERSWDRRAAARQRPRPVPRVELPATGSIPHQLDVDAAAPDARVR